MKTLTLFRAYQLVASDRERIIDFRVGGSAEIAVANDAVAITWQRRNRQARCLEAEIVRRLSAGETS